MFVGFWLVRIVKGCFVFETEAGSENSQYLLETMFLIPVLLKAMARTDFAVSFMRSFARNLTA